MDQLCGLGKGEKCQLIRGRMGYLEEEGREEGGVAGKGGGNIQGGRS